MGLQKADLTRAVATELKISIIEVSQILVILVECLSWKL